MRKVKKPVFFIVLLCIIAFGYLTYAGIHTQYGDIKTSYIKGVEDIRWGIDIQGGVNATFEPADNYDATKEEMDAVLKPENYTGRSEQQVEEFISEFIQPVLDENKDILGENFEMKN